MVGQRAFIVAGGFGGRQPPVGRIPFWGAASYRCKSPIKSRAKLAKKNGSRYIKSIRYYSEW